MKKLLLSAIAAASLALTGYSQQATNSIPEVPWWGTPLLDMLSRSNLLTGAYGMYDTTDKTYGGGVFLGYKINEMLVPMLRMDYVRDSVYAVSGNIQLQLPVDIFRSAANPEGTVRLTPLAFAGVATSWNNQNTTDNGNVIGIFGIGLAVTFKTQHSWWLPSGIAGDYERWTGGGFNDNQVRIGPFWKF